MAFLEKHKKEIIFTIVSAILILFLLFYSHFKGMTYYDEGYILNAALRVAHGQIPYKDFDMVYTPLSFLVTSGFLKIFGESIFAERVGALFVSLLSIIALILILRLITKNLFLLITSVLFFVVWGPMHINFAWPVMYASCFLLYTILFYLMGIKQKSRKYFFLAGLMTFLVFLSKQNFGAGTVVVLLLSFLFTPLVNKRTYFAYYASGILSMASVFFIQLLVTSSLFPFIENMYLYTLKRVFIDKGLDTPFLYEGNFVARFAKFFFYVSPLIISVICFWILLKKNRKLLFIPLLTAVFYFMGIRPTTDYVHVSPLIALSIVPMVLVLAYLKKEYINNFFIGIFLLYMGIGLYTAYYKGYYQWEAPLKEYTYFSSNPRIHLFLKEEQAKDAEDLQKYVATRTRRGEQIFVYYYAPLVYFITDRSNSTPYDLISTNQLPISYQMKIINLLKQKKIKLVMLHEFNKNEDALVPNYIRKNYRYTKTVAGFLIYEK